MVRDWKSTYDISEAEGVTELFEKIQGVGLIQLAIQFPEPETEKKILGISVE